MSSTKHIVQFYEPADFPVASVSAYLYEGLIARESCVVAAIPEHLASLCEMLAKAGVDLDAARADERFVELDVEGTLAKIMEEGMPDQRAFTATIAPILKKGQAIGKVRFFGELVAVLAAENNIAASLKLEEYWKALLHDHELSLFCAYPTNVFADAGGRESLLAICGQHTHLIPTERIEKSLSGDERFKSTAYLQEWNEQLHKELEELEKSISEKKQTLG